jgi:hypothetical protein
MKVDTFGAVCDHRGTIHLDRVGSLACWTKAFVQK